ncbi:MAG: LEPR-XLL domain-containing protein [Aquabacterium sp.]
MAKDDAGNHDHHLDPQDDPSSEGPGKGKQPGKLQRLARRTREALAPATSRPAALNAEPLEPRVLMSASPLGPEISGQINVAGETDHYTFTLDKDVRVVMDSLTDTDSVSWRLDGPQGNVVASRAFNATDASARSGDVALDLKAGDYTLSVDGSGAFTGDYRLRILDLSKAPLLTPGLQVAGTLDNAKATDAYQFSASAGERFFFDRTASPSATYWRLLGPDGKAVWSSSPTSMGSDVEPPAFTQSGIYTLLVEGRVDAQTTSEYKFTAHRLSDGETGIGIGQSVSGAITQPGQVQRYNFDLTDTKQVVFDALWADNAGVNIDFSWSLDGPLGRLVNERSIQYSDSRNLQGFDGYSADRSRSDRVVYTLGPGHYTVTMDTANDGVGKFAFRLLDLASATDITPGTVVNDTLAPGSSTRAYAFDVSAGERIAFDRISATNTDLQWRLIGPTGEQIFSTYFGNDVGEMTLLQAGRYTLLLEGRQYHTADNAISFNVLRKGNTLTERVTSIEQDFGGPDLDPLWQPGGVPTTLTSRGAPAYAFETLDGASVLRLKNTVNGQYSGVGWQSGRQRAGADLHV